MLHGTWNHAQNVVDILFGCHFQQTKAQTCSRCILIEPHRHQHVAWFGRSRMACGASADSNALEIKSDDERLTLNLLKANVGCVGHTRRAGAVYLCAWNLSDSCLETIAQCGDPLHGSIFDALH